MNLKTSASHLVFCLSTFLRVFSFFFFLQKKRAVFFPKAIHCMFAVPFRGGKKKEYNKCVWEIGVLENNKYGVNIIWIKAI